MENKYVDLDVDREEKKHKNVFVHIFVTSIVKTLRLPSERLKNWMILKRSSENCFFPTKL